MQDLINTIISHYTIVQHIAKGGMSDIYRARDLHTNQEVALKLVSASNQDCCHRFQREARAIASLHHEHILPALDYGEADPWCYLAMPYVPNGTLRDLTQEGPLTLDETGKYLRQVSSALYYAHQHGIIHRDIKPSNILMRDRDFVYLADFGLVKNTRNVAESLTETGFLVGTAAYMAPELAEEDATHLSDIYSLGIILYQMLTGDVPFKGSTPVGTFMQHLSKQPPHPSQVNPHLPAEFDDVVLRTLAKEPARRYQSALELTNAYQQALDVYAQRYANSQKTTQIVPGRLRKRPRRIVAAAVALAAAASFSLGSSAYMFHGAHISSDKPIANNVIQSHATSSDVNPPMLTKAAHLGHNTGKPTPPAPPTQPGNTATTNNTVAPVVDSNFNSKNTATSQDRDHSDNTRGHHSNNRKNNGDHDNNGGDNGKQWGWGNNEGQGNSKGDGNGEGQGNSKRHAGDNNKGQDDGKKHEEDNSKGPDNGHQAINNGALI